MFTGIIEETGKIIEVRRDGSNKVFLLASPLAPELKIDQSLAHNGVCLTVESIQQNVYQVTAIEETLTITTLNSWRPDDVINLERSMQLTGRLDGHLVQGHVDTVASCTSRVEKEGSCELSFSIPEQFSGLIIEKGSVSLNGVSLTIFNVTKNTFTVAVIPYTLKHTNLQFLEKGEHVNVEFDLVGKYVSRLVKLRQ